MVWAVTKGSERVALVQPVGPDYRGVLNMLLLRREVVWVCWARKDASINIGWSRPSSMVVHTSGGVDAKKKKKKKEEEKKKKNPTMISCTSAMRESKGNGNEIPPANATLSNQNAQTNKLRHTESRQ